MQANSFQKTLLDTIKQKLFDHSACGDKNVEGTNFLLPKDLVVVAFGTPLIAGDAFAPLVADAIRENFKLPIFVYGTTDNPINGKNMTEWLDFVKTVHKNALFVAIDASLGLNVGGIVVRKDGVCPAAVNGKRRRFGDIGILGVVAKNDGDALASLLSAKFENVQNMALDTAKLLVSCFCAPVKNVSN